MSKRKHISFALKVIFIFIAILSIISILGIGIAHSIVFGRIDYDKYDSEHYILYSDLDKKQYPRKTLQIQSFAMITLVVIIVKVIVWRDTHNLYMTWTLFLIT